jgi:hypothetical protein
MGTPVNRGIVTRVIKIGLLGETAGVITNTGNIPAVDETVK